MTTIAEVKVLTDDAFVLIRGQDLKQLLYMAEHLQAGNSPKGEDCFSWGKALSWTVQHAEVGR